MKIFSGQRFMLEIAEKYFAGMIFVKLKIFSEKL